MFLDVRDLTITLKTGEEIAKEIFNEPKEEYTKYLLSACTLERR